MEKMKLNLNIEDVKPKYTPYQKRKWTTSLKNYIMKMYLKFGNKTGNFYCGYMNICKFCSEPSFSSCVKIVKKVLANKNIDVDYNNYDDKYYDSLICFVEKSLE